MDGSAVRALAARVDVAAHGVGQEAAALRALATTGWSGPVARACERAVGEGAARAAHLGEDLREAAAVLRAHAAAVDRALADPALAALVAGGAVGTAAVPGAVAAGSPGPGRVWGAR